MEGGFGSIWVEATAIGQRTRKRFNESGERQLWLGFGRADANVVALDVIAGVTPAVDVWFQLVFLDLTFSRQTADTLRSTGFGDLRMWARWRIAEGPDARWPLAVRVGLKASLGASPIDAQILPLGEGQWDFEGIIESGYAPRAIPARVFLWTGYRARLEHKKAAVDPGGEFFGLLGGEVQLRKWFVAAEVNALQSRRTRAFGIVTGTTRRLVAVQLSGGERCIERLLPNLGSGCQCWAETTRPDLS